MDKAKPSVQYKISMFCSGQSERISKDGEQAGFRSTAYCIYCLYVMVNGINGGLYIKYEYGDEWKKVKVNAGEWATVGTEECGKKKY